MWPAIIAAAGTILSNMGKQGGQQHQNIALGAPSFFDQRQQQEANDPYADLYGGVQDPYAEIRQRAAQRFLSQG